MKNQIWAEVVTIGTELVLGQLVDSNAAFIASSLAEIGVGVACHTTVGDDRERMLEVLRTALGRCQIVITTGGIGPTEDDFTREIAAEAVGTRLVLRPDLLEHIEGLFKKMGFTMAPNNRQQAYIPDGATVIHNPRGTAPCFRYEYDDRVLICLPGVPWEMEHLIKTDVLPWLQQKYTLTGNIWLNRVLKVCGVGESNIDQQIREIIKTSRNPTIGINASPGEVKLRLTARAGSRDEAEKLLDAGEQRIREKIDALIFGYGDETLAGNTAGLVSRWGYRLAVVETVTRGQVAADLGRYLQHGELAGALILENAETTGRLYERAFAEFQANLVLAVAGFPAEDGKTRVEIRVRTADGQGADRDFVFGGPGRITLTRAATMSLFTLWNFLKDGTVSA